MFASSHRARPRLHALSTNWADLCRIQPWALVGLISGLASACIPADGPHERCGANTGFAAVIAKTAEAARAYTYKNDAPGSVDEPESPLTAPQEGPRWRVTPFLSRHLYSYGVALRRDRNDTCGSLLVANGHDHTPQYASQLAMHQDCTPQRRSDAPSERSLFYADVATADLDGDGNDEAILAALAGPDGRGTSGGLILAGDDGSERWIDRGIAASSLAIGDIDGDGDLDLAVGTYWAPPSAGEQLPLATSCATSEPEPTNPAPTVGQLLPRGAHGPVYVYLQEDGAFVRSLRIPSVSPYQLRLVDADLDGHLDLVVAGRAIEVLYGPLTAKTGPTCERLGLGEPGDYSSGIDVAHIHRPGDRPPHVVLAASVSCPTSSACGALQRSGVRLWQRPLDPTSTTTSPWESSFVELDGISSALRFTSLTNVAASVDSGERLGLDLIVGRLTTRECDSESRLYGHCFGAPLLGLRGRWSDDTFHLSDDASPLPLGDPRQRSLAQPMTTRILPYVSASGLLHSADELQSYDRPAATIITHRGTSTVIAVEEVRDATGPLPYNHIYGDRHISLKRRPSGPITVRWRVAQHPGFLVTSASPIDLAGPSVLIEPVLGDPTDP